MNLKMKGTFREEKLDVVIYSSYETGHQKRRRCPEKKAIGQIPVFMDVHENAYLRAGEMAQRLKSTDCSSKGPEFNYQQSRGGSQPSVMRSGVLFWRAGIHGGRMLYT